MKRFLKSVAAFSAFVCVGLVLLPIMELHAKVKILHIDAAKDPLALNNFRITKIVDDRLDTGSIGYITTGAYNYFLSANYENGLTSEFADFIKENTQQNANATPVSLHVLGYLLFEKSSFKGAEIAVNTHYALYDKNNEKLFDYVITDTRNTGMNMGAFAAELMRRNLLNFLSESDKNMPNLMAMYKKNVPLKTIFFIEKDPEEKNLLPYNPLHPLNLFNFVARPPSNPRGSSGSESGLRIEYQIRNLDGKPQGYIQLLTYFDQAKSWILNKDNAKDILSYEQVRFKISAFVTNELVKELQTKTFTLASFHTDIIALREKYNVQIKTMQTQYDQESEFGKNKEAIDAWNRKLAFYVEYTMN